jgi:hypothetical protein
VELSLAALVIAWLDAAAAGVAAPSRVSMASLDTDLVDDGLGGIEPAAPLPEPDAVALLLWRCSHDWTRSLEDSK